MEERKVTTEIGKDLARAKALLERGLTVAIPTETVYGLAANAFDPNAVAQIFEIKDRPRFDPLIVHAASLEAARDLVTEFPEWAASLAKRHWPGPITFVLPKIEKIPDLVTSGQPTVAVRVPAHPLTLDLLASLDVPLAAPSANPFGYVSPTTAEHVMAQLGGKIPYILDGGPCRVGVESTIVTEQNGKVVVLRPGGVSTEEIESIVGPVSAPERVGETVLAPGTLESHYAPRTPLVIGEPDLERVDLDRVGVLSYRARYPEIPIDHQITLSPEGDLREAARNLFAAIRYLDEQNVSVIYAERFPETGLGRAINDRLRRASAKRDSGSES